MNRINNLNQNFGLQKRSLGFWSKLDNLNSRIQLVFGFIMAVCAIITVIKLF